MFITREFLERQRSALSEAVKRTSQRQNELPVTLAPSLKEREVKALESIAQSLETLIKVPEGWE